jgi:hypothetical protein
MLEKHVEDGTWRSSNAAIPAWLLNGEGAPDEDRARLHAIRDDTEREGGVGAGHVAARSPRSGNIPEGAPATVAR